MTAQPPSPPAGEPPQLRPLGIGDIVDRVFSIYRSRPWLLLAIATIPYLVFVLIVAGVTLVVATSVAGAAAVFNQLAAGRTPDPNELAGVLTGFLLFVLVLVVVAAVVFSAQSAALVAAFSARYLGRDITGADAFRQGLGAAPRVIGGFMLLFLLLIALWVVGAIVITAVPQALVAFVVILACFVATIYILASTIVMPVVATLEGVGPVAALRRAWYLSEGNRWRILALQLLLLVLQLVISTVVSAILIAAIVGDQTTHVVLQQLVNLIASVAWTPMQWGTFAILYYDLRVRREAFDLQLAAEALPRQA